ncbi:hypothetical protein [Sporomusa sphaeroides]|uniref:hypothetical protein n=1 Tax=Sporomusa sphaeroides TaxID=47679 RepID=UPI0015E7FC3B|nr:hypothetical protein [Sporomusa sphaeroides]
MRLIERIKQAEEEIARGEVIEWKPGSTEFTLPKDAKKTLTRHRITSKKRLTKRLKF